MASTQLPPAAGANSSTGVSTCPNCGELIRAGELICSHCGTSLVTGATSASTRSLPRTEEKFDLRRSPIGRIPDHFQKVTLIIDGKQAMLPAGQKLIIGRADPDSNAPPPDIDLTPFDAADLGVSRQHIELTWRNDLIFLVDIGSTNGTLLNGQRLMPGIERILRDDDELVIGHMPVRVRFVDG